MQTSAAPQRIAPVLCRSCRRSCTPRAAGADDAPVGRQSASDWVSRWKTRLADGSEPQRATLTAGALDPSTAYRYVFVGGLSPAAHCFTALILRDALESRGVCLETAAASTREEDASPWTLTLALHELEETVRALPDDTRPLRLIGASVGALVAALYAERHPHAVDSLFLLSPCFDLRACLERTVNVDAWRDAGSVRLDGRQLHYSALADVDNHSAFPFVRCRAYVAHGNLDTFAALDDSLTWVRHASVNMRKRGMPSDEVQERRLLEVCDGHDLAASVPTLTAKLVDWLGLSAEYNTRVAVNLEGNSPEDANDHGSNFVVYREWLRQQGFDPDDMQ